MTQVSSNPISLIFNNTDDICPMISSQRTTPVLLQNISFMSKCDQTKPSAFTQSIKSPVIDAQIKAKCMLSMPSRKTFTFNSEC